MNLPHQQQKKDYSLLRPFDLEKAKSGDKVCTRTSELDAKLVFEYKGVIILEWSDGDVLGYNPQEIQYLRMKPLCWLEGKPVYKGDVLWNTHEGLEDYNYIVESFNGENIGSTPEGRGWREYLDNLSWVKREKQPEVLHDVNKFKVGDKVKVIRVLPCDEYWDKGWDNAWVREMDDYLGEVSVVMDTDNYGICLRHPYLDEFAFPSSVLELVEQPKDTPKKVKTLEVYLDGELIKKEEIEVE